MMGWCPRLECCDSTPMLLGSTTIQAYRIDKATSSTLLSPRTTIMRAFWPRLVHDLPWGLPQMAGVCVRPERTGRDASHTWLSAHGRWVTGVDGNVCVLASRCLQMA